MTQLRGLHTVPAWQRGLVVACFWGILATTSGVLRAADELDVLPAAADNPPAGRLYQWMQGQAGVLFNQRRQAVAALKTPEDVKQRQVKLREQFLEALGGFPERTPLNPQVTGKIERPDYRIEKIVYESRPQHYVTACLYLPTGPGPFPGVIVPCGHSANGKAAEAYQRVCLLLVKNGVAVLCYDPIGQGERIQLLNDEGKPAIPGSVSEHTMIGVGALLVGSSCATYRIWDGIRSLDYLASRPEIDPQRLGCTGNSGGGTLTAYLMALDDRIVAAAPSCYITTLEKLFATIGPQDAEQNIPGQVALGLEHADYLTMRAPKPTLICVGTKDFFNIDGAWTTYREAKMIYGILGHGERVDLFEFNDVHGFSLPRRQAAMRWMRRWLLKQDDAPVETDFPIHTDQELQCTRTGQVLQDYPGVSAFDLTRVRAEELDQQRAAHPLAGAELRAAVSQLIHLPENITPATPADQGTIKREGYVIHKEIFETEAGIQLPALRFVSDKPQPEALILYLHSQGKLAAAGPDGELQQLVKSGRTVLAVDLRGIGELSPGTAKGWGAAFGPDVREAFLGMHINRPLLGQRVYDLLSLVKSQTRDGQPQAIEIIATGTLGPVAQHAAMFDASIKSVTLRDSLVSWSSVAKTALSHHQLGSVVPGVLKIYDLPDLKPLSTTP